MILKNLKSNELFYKVESTAQKCQNQDSTQVGPAPESVLNTPRSNVIL